MTLVLLNFAFAIFHANNINIFDVKLIQALVAKYLTNGEIKDNKVYQCDSSHRMFIIMAIVSIV